MRESARSTGGGRLSNRNMEWIVFTVCALISFLLLIFADYRRSGQLRPFSSMQHGITIVRDTAQQIVDTRNRLADITSQYHAITNTLNVAEYIQDEMETLRLENSRLRRALDISDSLAFDNIVARIIARSPDSYYTFIINRGEEHGIAVDFPVVTIERGVVGLVGRVVATSTTSAVITTIIDRGTNTAAEHVDSELSGIIEGNTDSEQFLRMHIPDTRDTEDIDIQDAIVTSHLSSIYPSGILIGHVNKIIGVNHEHNFVMSIIPVINFNRLKDVFVLLPAQII